MDKLWLTLYKEAKKRINVNNIPPFIEYGNCCCAILSGTDKIYCGINISSNTNVNCTAEKSAITMMLNNGEKEVKKMVIINELEELIAPSEDCIEYLIELNNNLKNIEILIDLEKEKIVTLEDVLPSWWGTYRNKKN